QIRTLTMPNGQIGFVGKDVATVLGYSNPTKAIIMHVDEEDKLHSQIGNAGQMRDMLIINESGLYALILSSKLPKAREFKHWVTSVVLPQIRQTGGYLNVNQTMTEQEMLAQALLVAQKTIEMRNERIAQQQLQLEEQQPKVVFFDAVGESNDVISIDQMAKMLRQNGIDTGEKRLFKWLRRENFLGSYGKHYNVPNQRYVSQGLFTIEEQHYEVHGRTCLAQTPRVTGKGQEYFINGFISGRFTL
ncbi:MAG: phage antirepressor KilAC domain-containing protein, partial [Prevotellaceae bacterium]|nr:phage antirepressor KilAC domain-containing protein [Prevotellaceae bacterium]